MLVSEVRSYLPGFLGSATTLGSTPLQSLDRLMALREDDLNRVVAVHLALAEGIVDFVDGLREGLRRPLTSSVRPKITTQAVRGPIDWGDTLTRRALAGNDPSLFVVRPAARIFDTPENQALLWMIEALDRALRVARVADSPEDQGTHDQRWFNRVVLMRSQLRAASRHVWLRGITPRRPDPRTLMRLGAARTRLYKQLLPHAIQTLVRYTEEATPKRITELLCQHYFEPERSWQLFELVVSLRLVRAFEAIGESLPRRLLVGSSRPEEPFAAFRLSDESTVSLLYQGWPQESGESGFNEARLRHGLKARSTRPDITIVRHRSGRVMDAAMLELKATTSPSYLATGLSQLLGYLKERPTLWRSDPSGWLVAPSSPAFRDAEPSGGPLWIVSADAIGAAAVARFSREV
jgi:hypothetical protein